MDLFGASQHTFFTQNLGYLSNNPVAVNGRRFISRIKVIVLSNLISINVSNFYGWLEREVYFTYWCRDLQICPPGSCIQDQKRLIYFSCEYFGMTSKPFQKSYLSHIWKVLKDMACD